MKLPSPMTHLVRGIMNRLRQTTRTAVVGVVGTYDAATQRASVTPMVPEQDTVEGTARELPAPQLQEIPVLHYGGSLRGLTFGLVEDDRVVCLVRHRSHQEVDAGAEPPITPQDCRRMALSESVALPGRTTPQPAAHVHEDGEPVLYMDAGEALHLAIATANIALARADRTQEHVDALKSYLDSHGHPYVGLDAGAAGTTGAPAASSPTPPSLASTRIKVDE